MPRSLSLPILAAAAALLLVGEAARALDIQFDYTYDTGNFFVGHPDRQSLLESAAAVFESRLSDTLAAIAPSGGNTWSIIFDNPTTGAEESLSNVTIGAGVLRVFVGARQLGSGTLGEGGYGGFNALGDQAWYDAIEGRGQAGALLPTPTDFAPWGGSLTFDADSPWYFGTGSLSGKDDFLSVATHELGHLFGIGTADSWYGKISGLTFTGAQSTAANGGIQASLSGDLGHWASGSMSTVFGTSIAQEAAMDPALTVGSEKFFTTLDFAGLQDVGWTLVPEPSSLVLLVSGALALNRRRRSPVAVD